MMHRPNIATSRRLTPSLAGLINSHNDLVPDKRPFISYLAGGAAQQGSRIFQLLKVA
jgi:hypothetical protein